MMEYEAIALDETIGEFAFLKSHSRYAHGAVICHEMAHAITYSQTDLAAKTLGLEHLDPAERRAHQRLWQEVYRTLRGDFFDLLDKHYSQKDALAASSEAGETEEDEDEDEYDEDEYHEDGMKPYYCEGCHEPFIPSVNDDPYGYCPNCRSPNY